VRRDGDPLIPGVLEKLRETPKAYKKLVRSGIVRVLVTLDRPEFGLQNGKKNNKQKDKGDRVSCKGRVEAGKRRKKSR